jgi:hypothetical protein
MSPSFSQRLEIIGGANRLRAALEYIGVPLAHSRLSQSGAPADRKDLVGMVPVDLWALKLAWICFAIATVTGSFMHLARVSAILRIRWKDDDVWAAKPHPLFAGNYRLCLLAFAAGMAALAWFGFHNVN